MAFRTLMFNNPPKDCPLNECRDTLAQMSEDFLAFTYWQKWTCGGCRQRVMAKDANILRPFCECPKCSFVTDVTVTGCNYAVSYLKPHGEKR